MVTIAMNGSLAAKSLAAPARLSPMIATTAPVTSGGINASIQPAPETWTSTPIRV